MACGLPECRCLLTVCVDGFFIFFSLLVRRWGGVYEEKQNKPKKKNYNEDLKIDFISCVFFVYNFHFVCGQHKLYGLFVVLNFFLFYWNFCEAECTASQYFMKLNKNVSTNKNKCLFVILVLFLIVLWRDW